jgi:hypothetical protein
MSDSGLRNCAVIKINFCCKKKLSVQLIESVSVAKLTSGNTHSADVENP